MDFKIAKEPSYFPDQKRKSYIHRLNDNIRWTMKYQEANIFYSLYKQDLKGCTWKKMKEYEDYFHFMEDRAKRNSLGSPSSQVLLLRDKLLFYSYMKRKGLPVPEVFAFVRNGGGIRCQFA